ncbi:hypothetical protein [Paracoccus aeridis]|uniref:hypothetical protein n=1 Tax=Paracoccus aeridis TaxID=1966466 RepID=UPI0010AB1B71|nr:hypothetical protein [Paracoccus aeridis]
MLDQALDLLDPHIAELIWGAIVAYFGWVFRYIAKTKQAQDSLHRALGTGVDLVTDALVAMILTNPAGIAADRLAGQVVGYVKGSVPGALRWLLPSDAQLMRMAEAKLNAAVADLVAKMGPDRLAEALQQAGAPARQL